MKHPLKTLATALAILNSPFSILNSSAAVPLEWTARPGEIAPAQFTRHHGETLELRCRFAGFGEPPFSQGADIRLWYQTNGMPSSAWWSVPAQASSNTLSAVFAPECDPGADQVKLFFGAPSNVYASAVLRLRPSPGAAPNALPPPEGFAEADPVFAAWLATDPFAGLAPADYETVSNRAMSAVQPAEMEAATNALAGMYIPIDGSGPIISSVLLYLNDELHEQCMLRLTLPDGLSCDAASFVQSSMLTNEGAVVAARAYTDAAVASAVPAGVVVTNESGEIGSNLSIMGGISAGGSLQALNGTFYGLLTVNGTDITDAIAANATGISASAVAATNYTDAATNALAQSMGGTPAEIAVSGAVPYSKGLVNLTVSSGGTLACNTNDWPNGAQVLVSATLPATYTAASGINPVGYSAMPSDGQYLLVFTRLGQAVYVSVITSVE